MKELDVGPVRNRIVVCNSHCANRNVRYRAKRALEWINRNLVTCVVYHQDSIPTEGTGISMRVRFQSGDGEVFGEGSRC